MQNNLEGETGEGDEKGIFLDAQGNKEHKKGSQEELLAGVGGGVERRRKSRQFIVDLDVNGP